MIPYSLADDLAFLGEAYPDDKELYLVLRETIGELRHVAAGNVSSTPLAHNLKKARARHYQSVRAKGHKADMRIIFEPQDGGVVEILAFGKRHGSENVYERVARRRGL